MTPNDHDEHHASSQVVDPPERGPWDPELGSMFSCAWEWTSFAPVNCGDIRNNAPSFDEEDINEATVSFSEVFADVSMEDLLMPQADTQSTVLEPPLESPSYAFGDMSIGEPLISTSQMSLEFGGNETISADD